MRAAGRASAQEQPVVDAMLATLGEGPDVSSFQGRQYSLTRDRAAATVCIEQDGLERRLAGARPDEWGRPVALRWRFVEGRGSPL